MGTPFNVILPKCLDRLQIVPFSFALCTANGPLTFGIHQIRPYQSWHMHFQRPPKFKGAPYIFVNSTPDPIKGLSTRAYGFAYDSVYDVLPKLQTVAIGVG